MAENTKRLSFTAEKIDMLLNKVDMSGNLMLQVDMTHEGLEACVCDGETDDADKLQAFVDYLAAKGGGQLMLPQGKTIMIKDEIDLKSNVSIVGCGITSKIITDVGQSQNGLNMLKAFDKENIRLSNFYIENTGYGLSGTWEPMGTFDGAGACILMAGCRNVVIDNCHVVRGGGTIPGEGVSNIYLSCCYDCKAVNNHIEFGDNGLMVDTWYRYIDSAHAMFENDGIVFANNTIRNMTGRGICIENKTNKDKAKTKGNVTVVGNVISLCAYAGIQGNNVWNTVVSGNAIHGDCTDVDGSTVVVFGGSTSATWYGVAFEDESFDCIISDNVIKNIKTRGVYCKNARNVIVADNNIVDMLPGSDTPDKAEGVCIENDEYALENVNVVGNNMYGVLAGVRFIVPEIIATGSCMIANNNITFTDANARFGVKADNIERSSINGNNINPTLTLASTNAVGIECQNGKFNTINGNNIGKMATGINLIGDVSGVVNDNNIHSCQNGMGLNGCERTIVDNKFRSCEFAFNMSNGKTTQSTKCKSFNSHFIDVTAIKNGTGLVLTWSTSSTPTSGVFEVGDRVVNLTPSAGSPSEWVYYNGKWNNGFVLS